MRPIKPTVVRNDIIHAHKNDEWHPNMPVHKTWSPEATESALLSKHDVVEHKVLKPPSYLLLSIPCHRGDLPTTAYATTLLLVTTSQLTFVGAPQGELGAVKSFTRASSIWPAFDNESARETKYTSKLLR